MNINPYVALMTCCAWLTATAAMGAEATATAPVAEEIVVWGTAARARDAGNRPSTVVTSADLAAVNVATTEDLVKFEPSLAIRRRFIGDSNGTLGIRGSNMFQTSRSMVFADGVPLHYLLQTRWDGAPRWTLVSASEVARVEVLYGPYSAEFGGNSMGGVVLIETAIPQQREFHFDTSYFAQSFAAYGFDETLAGYKTFFSYGDRWGDTSIYWSYNRLQNAAQPQSYYFGAASTAAAPTTVRGAIAGHDERSVPRLWFGDSGVVDTSTDNYKFKLGHDFGIWQTLLNIAYEDRRTLADAPNSYLRTADATVWSGVFAQEGSVFEVPSERLGVALQQRDSLSMGLRLRGQVTERVALEANINQFSVLRDETRSSMANPADPAYTGAGQVMDFGKTGWRSAETKLSFAPPSRRGLEVVTGARHEAYELNLDVYDSSDYAIARFDEFVSRSGGKTRIDALYAQVNVDLNEQWDTGLGVRWEAFESSGGYVSGDARETNALGIVAVPRAQRREVSPKFSLGYRPRDRWHLAYAAAQAYRFPIVEELYSQYSAYNSVGLANPKLEPEDGLHHNLSIERSIDHGVLRLNLFQERIENVIEAQAENLPGGLSVRTFVPVDEIETRGAEVIASIGDLLAGKLDLRLNLAYTDSVIVRNTPNPEIEGNRYPRLPEWRANMLATYRHGERWELGATLQYASDSFGRNDNRDREQHVYGAIDPYTRVGLKTTYRSPAGLSVALGVDNLTDELSYVAHPWPGRTWYASVAHDW